MSQRYAYIQQDGQYILVDTHVEPFHPKYKVMGPGLLNCLNAKHRRIVHLEEENENLRNVLKRIAALCDQSTNKLKDDANG